MHHQASCHCGQNRFTFDGDIAEVLACNCSICRRRGSLLWFTPRENLKLQTPEEASRSYTFHKHVIRHRFCPTCGIHLYGEGASPQGVPMAAINVRCVEGIDLDAIPVRHFDGRAL
ncbi:GFA family protein [Pseudorhodoferax sp.]|uniref:GFA family protein n=1 Tax=Pseudorhodoferax sp. TaxID=1993553 RepID=UPI0039E3311C